MTYLSEVFWYYPAKNELSFLWKKQLLKQQVY